MVWQGDSSAHSSGDARAVVRTQIQEDFASVTISFDSLNVQTITQTAKYNVNINIINLVSGLVSTYLMLLFVIIICYYLLLVCSYRVCPGRSSRPVSGLQSADGL